MVEQQAQGPFAQFGQRVVDFVQAVESVQQKEQE